MIEDRPNRPVRVGGVTIRTVDRVAIAIEARDGAVTGYASKRPVRIEVETDDGSVVVELDEPN